MIKRRIIANLFILLALACPGMVIAQQHGPAGIEEAELSARLSEDLGKLLVQLVGKDKSRVFALVEGETVLKTTVETSGPAEEELALPGYSTTGVLEKTSEYLKKETRNTAEFRIKKMSVSMVFDRSVPDARIKTIRMLVADILRLNDLRGDAIVVAKAEMLPWWKNMLSASENQTLLMAAMITAVLLLGGMLLAYMTGKRLIKVFFTSARSSATELPALSQKQPEIAEDDYPDFIDVETAVSSKDPGASHEPLAFMDDLSAADIAMLLREEPADDIAAIMTELSEKKPLLASKILVALAPAQRQAVTAAMTATERSDPDRLQEIGAALNAKAGRKFEGAGALGKILSLVEDGSRTDIMNELSRSEPDAAAKLRGSVLTFADICQLEERDIKQLVQALPSRDWTAALSGLAPEVAARVTALFPGTAKGSADETANEQYDPEVISAARAKIISLAMDLSAKGRLELKAGGRI